MYFDNLIVTDNGLRKVFLRNLINNKLKNTYLKVTPTLSLLTSKIKFPRKVAFRITKVFI